MLKIWIAYFAVYQKQLLVQISFYGLIESVTQNLYLEKKKKKVSSFPLAPQILTQQYKLDWMQLFLLI